MRCRNCGLENADGKFCKECGHKLERTVDSEGVIEPADHVLIGELVYAAYKHRDAGEINEALFSCRKAVEANPENASAHSLLASLYELDGDMESAMYEYERALALDPKSTSDRARLEDLKVLFDISVHAKAESGQLMNRFKPYIPVARAVAVICLVLVVGLTLGRGSSKHQETPTGGASSAVTNVTPAVQIDARQQQEPPPQGVDAQQPAPAQASTSRQVKTDSPAAEQSASTKQPMTQTPTPPTQPTARTASANEKPVITPVITTPTQPDNTSRVSSPILPVESSPSNAVTSVGTASSDPERYAFRLQTMQRYQQAISSYQEALAKTKDKGRIYQQIAMCYQNLGERDLAVNNLNQAIRAYRDQAAAGRDKTEVDMNIKACQRAIEVNRK